MPVVLLLCTYMMTITLGTKAGFGLRRARPGANCKQEGRMDKACNSLTRLAVVRANSRVVLCERNFNHLDQLKGVVGECIP